MRTRALPTDFETTPVTLKAIPTLEFHNGGPCGRAKKAVRVKSARGKDLVEKMLDLLNLSPPVAKAQPIVRGKEYSAEMTLPRPELQQLFGHLELQRFFRRMGRAPEEAVLNEDRGQSLQAVAHRRIQTGSLPPSMWSVIAAPQAWFDMIQLEPTTMRQHSVSANPIRALISGQAFATCAKTFVRASRASPRPVA